MIKYVIIILLIVLLIITLTPSDHHKSFKQLDPHPTIAKPTIAKPTIAKPTITKPEPPKRVSTQISSKPINNKQQPIKIPENHITNPICKHEGIMEILSKLRRDCIGGHCDINQMLKEMNSISQASFLSLIRRASKNKITFFFKKNTTEIDHQQIEYKKDDLKNILTEEADRKNTIAFIVAKASTTGNKELNREISSQRAIYISQLIKQIFREENLVPYLACNEIYKTYVGAELFQISEDQAKESQYINSADIARAMRAQEDLTEYINQSVVLFTYPCFKEMCYYMHNDLSVSCDDLPPECKYICDQ